MIENIFKKLSDNFREDLILEMRIRKFDPDILRDLIRMSWNDTFLTDLLDYLEEATNYYCHTADDLEALKLEVDENDSEISRLNNIIAIFREDIRNLKEKPLIRDEDARNFVLTFTSANGRLPTMEEIWKQATLIMEEKMRGVCAQHQKCARTQFCKKDGEDCFEERNL